MSQGSVFAAALSHSPSMLRSSTQPIPSGTVFQQRYEILSLLGEGGFGQVYRARQCMTGQEVAIKVLRHWQEGSELQVARFRREAQLCAQLHHPHIVRLMDSGSTEEGQLYTVFELVPGQTLAEVLASGGALERWETVRLMMQVLDALACAHRAGVIHRDLKPQNLMVTATGVLRHARVLDFGLGRLMGDGAQAAHTPLTLTREGLGTPAYAAPEQLRGEPASPRSDLYSWGLIFLECLTGQPVVRGQSLQEVLYKQLGPEALPLPEELEVHWLGGLLRRVLAKEAGERDVTTEGLLRELERGVREGRLGAVGPALPVSREARAEGHGERRQVTTLCCGLTLQGPGAEALDVEDQDRLLRAQYETCAEVAGRFGGSVGSALGDRVLLYFGFPQAAEDDARRAARAALEMVVEVERRGSALAGPQGLRLALRVGLHTGLVVRQEPEGGPAAQVGQTSRGAARLEALAEPGAILVSAQAEALLREHYLLGTAGPSVFRLYGMLGSESSTSSREERPMFGRAQELELLRQRWGQVQRGMGQGLLISGEPGIGKSRLVRELMRQEGKTPHTLMECRCAPESRHSALRPVVEMLERLLGLRRDWTAARSLGTLEALLERLGFDLARAVPLLSSLLDLSTEGRYPALDLSAQHRKELTLDTLVSLFFEMTAQQPVMLLVEDLHWADPTTLELLGQLVEAVAPTSLLLVLTARPEFTAPWPAAQLPQVRLNRLERQEVERMVSGLAGELPLPPEVREQVALRADGVPLFIEQLTRVVLEEWPTEGGITPSRQRVLSVPTTLRDLLTSRLDRLGPARETTQVAAALGREFGYEVLRAVSPREEALLQRDLTVLVEADLVQRRRGARGSTYLFKHALIRDAAYESLSRPARRQLHVRISAALEQHFPQLVETRPDLLAQHHAAAEQKRQALDYALKAARGALMRSANLEAIAHATEALDWLQAVEDAHERARLELGLVGIITPAMMSTRGWGDEGIKDQVERAQVLITQLGDDAQLLPNLWALAIYHHTRGHRQQALVLAERMAALTTGTDVHVAILPLLGQCLLTDGRLEEARRVFERALELYDPERHRHLGHLYGIDPRTQAGMGLGLLLWMQGQPARALEHARAAVSWSQTLSHWSSLGLAYLYLLTFDHQRGEPARLLELADKALELSNQHLLTAHHSYFQMFQCWAKKDLDSLATRLSTQESLGFGLGLTYYGALLVELELELGRYGSALARVEGLIRRARETGECYHLPELLRLQALCLLEERPEGTEAEQSLRSAIHVAREQGARLVELRSSVALCRLLGRRGQAASMHEPLRMLLSHFTEGEELAVLTEARMLLREPAA